MEKRYPYSIDDNVKSVLIVGEPTLGKIMQERIVQDKAMAKITIARAPLSGFDLMILIGHPRMDEHIQYCSTVIYMTYEEVLGKTPAQVELINTDWRAIRDMEALLMQLDRGGVIKIPFRIKNAMRKRSMLRDGVDEEIANVL